MVPIIRSGTPVVQHPVAVDGGTYRHGTEREPQRGARDIARPALPPASNFAAPSEARTCSTIACDVGYVRLVDVAHAPAHRVDGAEEHPGALDVADRDRAGGQSLERVPHTLLVAELHRELEVPREQVGTRVADVSRAQLRRS